jgi:putative ABC transport system ATP-binding protein
MILKTEKLTKSFMQGSEEIKVLQGVDFQVNAGETIAILGKSGSGKSTLLSLLCGIESPNNGDVFYESKGLTTLTEDQLTDIRASHIGVIFQQFHLIEHLNAIENVMLPLEILGKKNCHAEALHFLEKVGMEHRQDHFPSQLSGGEKQRIAIARSLAASPKILLADEPSGSLDEKTGDDVMKLIFGLVADTAMSLILVTHDQQLAKKCQKIYHLEDGCLRLDNDL